MRGQHHEPAPAAGAPPPQNKIPSSFNQIRERLNGQQKIVIKLRVPCEKCSSKALVLAAAADGVSSVTLEGADRDQVVVVGDGVDAACLTTSLRKKVGCVLLVSVEEVKPKPTEEKKCGKPKDPPPCGCRTSNPPCHHPQLEMCKVVYDPHPPPCTIM